MEHLPTPVLDPNGTIEELAERLLTRIADTTPGRSSGDSPNADSEAGPALSYDDLTDRQSQRLVRPLLACLALKSEAENGTPVNVCGGTLSFIRAGESGPVRITAEFDNRPGAVRVTFGRTIPIAGVTSRQTA